MAFQAGSIVTRIGGDLGPLVGAFAQAKRMAGGFLSDFSERMKGAAVNPFAGLLAGAGAAVSVGAAVHRVLGSMDQIDEIAKTADRVGITTEAYVGLAHAANLAGVEQESLDMSLQFLQKSLTSAAAGAGEAVAAFDRLHLDARALADLPAEQAIGRIGDALKGVANPAERASLAMDLFGARGGPRLLALLSTGAAGIAQAREEAAKLGLTFSRIDAAKVEQANDAMTRLGSVAEGVSRNLAIGLAPYIEGIATRLTDAATSGTDMGLRINAAVEVAAKSVAYLADTWSLVQAAYYRVTAAGSYFATAAVIAIDKVAHAASYLSEKLGGGAFDLTFLDDFTKAMDATHDDLLSKAGRAWEDWSNGVNRKAVGRAFEDFKSASAAAAEATARDAARMRGSFEGVGGAAAKQAATAAEALEKMRKDLAQFGMTEAQKRAADFTSLSGVKPEQVVEFKGLAKQLDAKNHMKELTDQAKQFLDGIKTPADKALEVVDALNAAFAQGKITAEQFDQGVAAATDQAKKGIEEDAKKQQARDLPALVRAGSAEAVRVAFQAQRDNGEKSYRDKSLALMERIAKATEGAKPVELAMTDDD